MKLASWNVNGIRASKDKGFLAWVESEKPDVICLQEIKAKPEQLDSSLLNLPGYEVYWNPADKPGYSGVATYTKIHPLSVERGFSLTQFDCEGRVQTTEYDDFFLVNAYFPNSQREHTRLDFKLGFCDRMLAYLKELQAKSKEVVLCGDFNIAHEPIDLRNPKQNEDNAGYLPQERAWMTHLLSEGYRDVFRERVKEPHHYTWWSYRPGIREKNIGWRLDYHVVSDRFADRVKSVYHQPKIKGSDHCPTLIELF